MWPPKARTFCLVKTGCRARLRGSHCSLGRTNRLSPARCRTSSCTTHRSADASLRPSTSRMPLGEKTATTGGTQPRRAQLDAGDGAAGVAEQFLTGVESPHRLHQLPIRQRIVRRQRQRADVAHACQLQHLALALGHHGARHHPESVGAQPQRRERVGGRPVSPHRDDVRVVADGLGAGGEFLPHRRAGFVIGVPLHHGSRRCRCRDWGSSSSPTPPDARRDVPA